MTDKSQDQAHPQTVTVPLDTPLQQGDQKITSVTLRRPLGGALRGVKLVDLYNMDVIAVSKVVPRISTPVITEQNICRCRVRTAPPSRAKSPLFCSRRNSVWKLA